jgi:hypothetical protein
VILTGDFRIIPFFFSEVNSMFSKSMNIADFDPDLWSAMQHEETRQEDHIELIASENYTSPRVMQAQGSVLTNKYAEGYPVRGRLPGQALLRWLRVCRRGRSAGAGASEKAV